MIANLIRPMVARTRTGLKLLCAIYVTDATSYLYYPLQNYRILISNETTSHPAAIS
jgi:hypothetical protein